MMSDKYFDKDIQFDERGSDEESSENDMIQSTSAENVDNHSQDQSSKQMKTSKEQFEIIAAFMDGKNY